MDDDVLIAESNKFILKKAGYNIVGIATEGLQAINLAKEKEPDLILMDVNLGTSMDGITAAEEIQKFTDIPFIFLTAYSDNATIERAKKVGPFGYLIKPFDNRELLVSIETSLYKHSFEKKVKEQELLFRTVANFAYEWEFWISPELDFKYCSPSCFRITGYKPEEFITNSELLFDIVHPEDKAMFQEHIRRNYQEHLNEVITDLQYRIIDKQSNVKFISHTCSAIFDDKQNYLGKRGTNVDITQRKLTELVLLESEERNRVITETANDSIITINSEGKIQSWNKASEKIFGYSIAEMIGNDLSIIIPNQYKDAFKKTFDGLKNGRVSKLIGQTVELTALRKNASEFPIEISLSNWESNNKKYYTAIIRDITERILAEDNLKQANFGLQLAIEGGNLGTFDTDISSGIVKTNEFYGTMLGYEPGEIEMTRDLWISKIHPDDLQNVLELSEKIDSGEIKSMETEYRIKNKSGNWIWISDRAKGFNYTLDGKPTRAAGTHRDITERKLAEEALRESEKNYRIIFNSTNEAIFIHDAATGKILDVNDSMLKMYGYESKNELLDNIENFRAAELPYNESEAVDFIRKTVLEGPQTFEWLAKKKNGERFWTEVSLRETEISGYKRVLAVVRDITERKLSEKLVNTSKERWENLFNNSPSAIAIYKAIDKGKDFVFTDFNLTAQMIEKVKHADVVGKRISKLFPGAEELGFLDVLRKVSRTGETERIKSFYYKDNRIEGWRENIVYKLNTGEIVAIYNDVSERMNSEIALRESEEKMRLIVEGTSFFFFYTQNTNGDLIYISPTVEKITGRKVDEWMSQRHWVATQNPINLEATKRTHSHLQGEISAEPIFLELTHKNGSLILMEIFENPIFRDNKVIGIQGIAHDITEKKKTENELDKYREHLEELVETRTEELDRLNADLIEQLQKEKEYEMILRESLGKEKDLNELKTKFISITSHEFRTPLTSVLTSAELLKRYLSKWDETKRNEHFERIINSVGYLTKLLDDVLTIGRTESGKISYLPETIDVLEFVGNYIEEIKNHSAKHQITFTLKSSETRYFLDRKLLRFILSNLLSNATKYSPEGGKVELIISSENDYLKMVVIDHGIGIPKEEIGKIFESFYRTKNAENISGTGLGLAIVKSAVDLHGGKIEVKSELGKGSTFEVRLPIKL